jgi:hypothetical protein
MKRLVDIPKFKSESKEADWWASWAGREYVKRRSTEVQSREAQPNGAKPAGSRLVAQLIK